MSEPTETVPSFFFMLTGALLGLFIIGALFYAANTSNIDDSAAATVLGALPSFTCGVSTVQDADANVYNTVQIGTQCWMKQNMRVGTRINGATTQTNNATIEKWCYSNSDANCTSDNPNEPDGGLYQWNEAMQYSTTPGAQGICPAGWHIPTHDEFTTLERAVCTSGTCATDFPYDTTTTGFRGTNEGIKLMPNGTSGFEANFAGYALSGVFDWRAELSTLWTSSESSTNAWGRILDEFEDNIQRNTSSKSRGYSVRCLKDDPNPPNPTFTIANTITSPGSTLEDGLVGHWTFDGPTISGTTVTDQSGNGNNGTLVNGPTKAIGKVGQGMVFSRSLDQYINAGSNTSFDDMDTMTIAAWVKPQTSAFVNTANFARKGTSDVLGWNLGLWSGYSNDVVFNRSFSGTDGFWYTTANPINKADEWYFVVVTYNSNSVSNDPKMYVNGVSIPVTKLGPPTGTPDSDASGDVMIAGRPDGSRNFDGSIDDVRIYNRILSAAEVEQLYRLGQGATIKICKADSVQDADANVYNTLAIGSQCWLDRNMNVGTRINGVTAQTNNGTVEKYCYSNLDTNCNNNNPNRPDGGLYRWNEAMQYSTTTGARGICPAGFHIPTDAEWHTLEKFLKDSGKTCDPNRSLVNGNGCSSAGIKLLPNGSTGFEANKTGNHVGMSFDWRGSYSYHWSSTGDGETYAAYRSFGSGDLIFRGSSNPLITALSVRCIQD